MNVIAKISCYFECSVITLNLRKEYLYTVPYNTPVLLRMKYWSVWYIERYSTSAYAGVTNFQKTVRFLAHPVYFFLIILWHCVNWIVSVKVIQELLEKVAMNDTLSPKAARRDTIAKLKSFWGFESELQTNPMPFHLDSPWGAMLVTLMPLTACAMD